MLSTRFKVEGTIGITGGIGEEDGYYWWVLLEYLILFQKGFTGAKGYLTSG